MLDRLLERLPGGWHSPLYAVIVSVAVFFGGTVAFRTAFPGLPVWVNGSAGVIAALGSAFIWWWTNRLPTASGDDLGIVVAIWAEDDRQARQLRTDFAQKFRHLLTNVEHSRKFELLEVRRDLAKQVVNEYDYAYVLDQTGAQFAILGSAGMRLHKGSKTHVLNLQAAIRHRAVNDRLRQQLFGDFGAIFPERWLFPVDSDFMQFEAGAAWMDVAARYYVALAAILAFDFEHAEELLSEVERRKTAFGGNPARQLTRKLPKVFVTLYDAQRALFGRRFFLKRNDTDLRAAEEAARKIHQREPGHYGASITRAIAAFYLRRDVGFAEQCIARCTEFQDPTWRYSRAFLHAYEGTLDRAYVEYLEAFKRPLLDRTVPVDAEEFIRIILTEEPEKSELYFAVGMINLFAKEDFESAKGDFSTFLSRWPDGADMTARSRAENMLEMAETKVESESTSAPG